MPAISAMARAVGMNGSVTITAAGTPRFSNKVPSSRLLELHEPQSPIAAITAWQRSAIIARSPSGTGMLASDFSTRTVSATA